MSTDGPETLSVQESIRFMGEQAAHQKEKMDYSVSDFGNYWLIRKNIQVTYIQPIL